MWYIVCVCVCSTVRLKRQKLKIFLVYLVVMIDVNSGTGRLLICGVRFAKFDSITRWRTAGYCIPTNPRYDIVEDLAGREDPLVLGALLIPDGACCGTGAAFRQVRTKKYSLQLISLHTTEDMSI